MDEFLSIVLAAIVMGILIVICAAVFTPEITGTITNPDIPRHDAGSIFL